ncbi:hypothetical protein CO608_06980 [Lysobacteraceae bacterium NML08-0793]|nr:hypothetical protein CO608_06980 [Xanthomonadaceae bacterium NML08-0793]
MPGGSGRRLLVVVGRELCLFSSIDASRIPAKQRREFIELAVRRASPFPDPEYDLTWFGAHAAIWYWPRSRVTALLGNDFQPDSPMLAESGFVPPSTDTNGAELLRLEQGYNGRIWDQQHLLADRWWPDIPSQAEWTIFLRSAGQPASDLPEVSETQYQTQSWFQRTGARRTGLIGASGWLKPAAIALASIGCLLVGLELGSGLRGVTDLRTAEQTRSQLGTQVDAVFAARSEAEANAAELIELLQLRPIQTQSALLAEVRNVMPTTNWQINNWAQPEPGKLEVAFIMPDAAPDALVSAWEASPMFDSVSANIDSNSAQRIVIRAKVMPSLPALQQDAPAEVTP